MQKPVELQKSFPILEFMNVYKVFENNAHSLIDVSLSIAYGEFIFVCGRTGSGKSTFLRLITKELEPTQGSIKFENTDLACIKKNELPFIRRKIGVVRQGNGLFLEKKTVAENIEFAMRATGHPEKTIKDRARSALTVVGMSSKADCNITELSIGERKRVEIARSIINHPKMIIADEPTANLDGGLSWDIMGVFDEINRMGVTVIIATHDKDVVNIMRKRVLTFAYGKLLGDVKGGRYGDLV
ncbi:MAG: ATP-binding cassette domain-containing protein [Clostridiales bacterium]|nr:ATP-binding cassette domain-containing protein [Clostridiales bacterium]